MLDALRRQATGWVVKGFLVLLIVSFAIWGIGDVLRTPGPSDEVARVGGEPIPSDEVVRDTERNFRRLREQFGDTVERSPAVMENLFRQALAQAIARRLLDLHARELGLTLAPTTLATLVREDPTFEGPNGFDRQRFDFVLRELGLSEAGYLEQLRGDLLRSRLVEAVTGAVAAPELLARELARYREERRVGRALLVPAAAQDPGQPDEATLAAWLERNAARFRVPELRAVELVVLGVEELLAESMPSEEELRAAYEERRATYTTPEQRTAIQLLAADRAVIDEAERLAREGKSFADIATALEGRGLQVSTVGPVARGVLPDPLDGALFGLEPGGLSPPLETPFGWHLLRLESVTPESVRPFEEVKDALAEELARRRAADRLPEVAERLDDALAAGEDLEAAARAVGARHLRIPAVDAQGRDADGRALDAIDLSPEMLQEIVGTPAGRTSLLVHGKDDRWFVVKVESVTPSRDRRLDEVRLPVEIGWKLERQRELARDKARALLERVRAGDGLPDLARAEPGLQLATVGPLRRRGDPEPLGPAVTRALFTTAPGRIAEEPVPTPEGFALVATDEILPAAAEVDLAPLRRELRESLSEAMFAAYEQALRRRFPVETDERAIARLVESFGR
ncbi:MAG: peptidyl-prolyl cis-trans isomerase [Geminicoccaceae bacterium]